MKAIAHGTFEVSVENQILVASGKGPFNKELILDYQAAVNKMIDTLAGTKWAAVVCLYGESLMTPEAEVQLISAIKQRIDKGMVATASVFLESNAVSLQYRQMGNIYKAANANYKLFEDQAEAIAWAKSCLNQN